MVLLAVSAAGKARRFLALCSHGYVRYFPSVLEYVDLKLALGGETRPELQAEIFEPTYPAGTYEKQDFVRCIYTTHASYIFHHDAFKSGGYNGAELDNAIASHARLGYNFLISRVAAAKRENDAYYIDIAVDLRQIGVAPFYYDLDLALDCDGLSEPLIHKGAESLVADMDTKTFTFEKIPSSALCLQSVRFMLQSSYAFPERPIKFAQGNDGKVSLAVPLPDGSQPDNGGISNWGVASGFYVSKGPGRSYNPVDELSNGKILDLADFEDETWTIHANITNAHSATFRYDGQAHSVSHSSFALSGDVQGYSRTITYLSTPGHKRITVSAFTYEGDVIGYATVEFVIVDSRTSWPSAGPTVSPSIAITDETSRQEDDLISSDKPHGFNTPETPTVLEMNTNDDEAARKKSRQKLGMIFFILCLIAAAFVILSITWIVRRRCAKQSEAKLDDVDDNAGAEDDKGSGTSSPSEPGSLQSSFIIVSEANDNRSQRE